MSDSIIQVQNVGKRYILNHQERTRHTSLKDVLTDRAKSTVRSMIKPKLNGFLKQNQEEFWALRDVSFDVKPGDRVGIIGRNGAGKSTLLKILSRITESTTGRISMKGRVASLLEVGTGFHPELSGRENIFLNGAILGMSRSEIKRKFDEIVAFAEVERFIDTPVKRYSSGMYVRLAFAVAAHLEPEILVVDEVLAVGDVQFQKKCIGKMEDVGKQGRTILFVSHNMSAVESLCNRGVLLEGGTLTFDGTAEAAVRRYLDAAYEIARRTDDLYQRHDRSGTGKIRVSSFRILDDRGCEVPSMQSGKDYIFEVGYRSKIDEPVKDVAISLDIFDDKGNRLMLFRSNFTNENLTLEAKEGVILCAIQNLPLASGAYRFSLYLVAEQEKLDHIEDAAVGVVEGGDFFGTGSGGLPAHCKILAKARWSTRHEALIYS